MTPTTRGLFKTIYELIQPID